MASNTPSLMVIANKKVIGVNPQIREAMLLSKTKIISLLPIGITYVDGDFNKGDIIEIVGNKKQKIGFGIVIMLSP